MEQNWKVAIQHQREQLAQMLHEPLTHLAQQCAPAWCNRHKLNEVLLTGFAEIPHCTFLYVVNTDGIQVSDNIGCDGLMPEHYGRDRSQRPYMREVVPSWGFLLSEAYVSMRAHRPSLTALHIIRVNGKAVGYLGADFDLRNLPVTAVLYEEPSHWIQIKGDPSIRSTVFQQIRTESQLDRNVEQAFSILEELFEDRGVFQAVIHFSMVDKRQNASHKDFINPVIGIYGNMHIVHYPETGNCQADDWEHGQSALLEDETKQGDADIKLHFNA
jgi:hypothetical protein